MPIAMPHMKISPVRPSRQLGLEPPEGMRGRSEGQRRGTEGVFVGCDFDNGVGGQIQFPGYFLNGTAGLIRWQSFEKPIQTHKE